MRLLGGSCRWTVDDEKRGKGKNRDSNTVAAKWKFRTARRNAHSYSAGAILSQWPHTLFFCSSVFFPFVKFCCSPLMILVRISVCLFCQPAGKKHGPCSQPTHVTKIFHTHGLCRAKDLAPTSFLIEKQEVASLLKRNFRLYMSLVL